MTVDFNFDVQLPPPLSVWEKRFSIAYGEDFEGLYEIDQSEGDIVTHILLSDSADGGTLAEDMQQAGESNDTTLTTTPVNVGDNVVADIPGGMDLGNHYRDTDSYFILYNQTADRIEVVANLSQQEMPSLDLTLDEIIYLPGTYTLYIISENHIRFDTHEFTVS